MINLAADLLPMLPPARAGAPPPPGDALFVLPESVPAADLPGAEPADPGRQEDAAPGKDAPVCDAALLALFLPPPPPPVAPDAPSSLPPAIAVDAGPAAVAVPLPVATVPTGGASVDDAGLSVPPPPADPPVSPPTLPAAALATSASTPPIRSWPGQVTPVPPVADRIPPAVAAPAVSPGQPVTAPDRRATGAGPGHPAAIPLPTHWRIAPLPAMAAPAAIADVPAPSPMPDGGSPPVMQPAVPPGPAVRQVVLAAATPTAAGLARARPPALDAGEPEPPPGAPSPVAGPSALTSPVLPAPLAGPATLDMRRDHWPQDMIGHIERLRDAADAVDTRIRLVPDALGGVSVDVRREGDTLHVRFHAEQAQTRALLQDAQPHLAEAAEARGLKLGGSSVDGGAQQQQHRQSAAQPASAPPRRIASAHPSDEPSEDIRIA